MTKFELKRILDEERINPIFYDLEGELQNDRLCLSQTAGIWRVYYSERGQIWDDKWFASEDEACDEFLRQIRRLLPYGIRLEVRE
jgi:hypothetical protein